MTKFDKMMIGLMTLAGIAASVAVMAEERDGAYVRPLAELSVSGGFTPVPVGPRGVRILSDGRVEAFAGRMRPVEIARLTVAKARQLAQVIEQIRPMALVDPHPELPPCMDAPVVHYLAFKRSGEQVEIHRVSGCHEFLSHEYGAAVTRQVLQGMQAINDLR